MGFNIGFKIGYNIWVNTRFNIRFKCKFKGVCVCGGGRISFFGSVGKSHSGGVGQKKYRNAE